VTTTKDLAVLDRTKEPGAIGEPLYMDVVTAFCRGRHAEACMPLRAEPVVVIGGRYGLSSKEFNAGHGQGRVRQPRQADQPKNHFTVGIVDDVTHLSLPVDDDFDIAGDDVFRGVFFGLGADGTVGANKNSIKIIGEETDNYAQGYFVYDSKKAGAVTISHLRFGPKPIRSSYLIKQGQFVACHQWVFLEKYDMLELRRRTGRDLPAQLAPTARTRSGTTCPRKVQQDIIEKKLKVYCIDATRWPRDRDGPAHQHHHADLLLRHLRHPAARRGHRQDQGGDQEDLRRQEGRRDRPAQLRAVDGTWPTCTR
jgi:pyruvate-ferredoxin/flavodoxin oxidoreductase